MRSPPFSPKGPHCGGRLSARAQATDWTGARGPEQPVRAFPAGVPVVLTEGDRATRADRGISPKKYRLSASLGKPGTLRTQPSVLRSSTGPGLPLPTQQAAAIASRGGHLGREEAPLQAGAAG